MNQLGLIGYPLSHSFSPAYFNEKFHTLGLLHHYQYKAFPLERITDLPTLLTQYPNLKGFNVTIPYKQDILTYLDDMDDSVKDIGACNCVSIRFGRLKGYNTDAFGFQQSLQPLRQPHHQKALILGSGGASKAVAYSLKKNNIPYHIVSRQTHLGHLTYHDLNLHILNTHNLIINTTPLGMSPKVDEYPPLDYTHITPQHLCYDLIYNPQKTLFLAMCEAQGAVIKNGHDMLILQAEESWRIWQEG